MKALLKILAGGLAVFMLLAVVEEWPVFRAWLRPRPAESTGLSEDERKAAADTVHLALSLMRHLYVGRGDPRFVERMPVSSTVAQELLADIEYLTRNHRLQDPGLERLEVIGMTELGREAVEVRTREVWRFRILWGPEGGEAESPRVQTAYGKYLVVRSGAGWRVEGWQPVDPPQPVERGDA